MPETEQYMPTHRSMLVKRAIIDAMDSLLATRTFDQISVQDICERAQVSRTTFYRHFEDKYHLVNWTYENYKDILNVRGPENETYQLSLSYLLACVKQKQNYFRCALKYAGQNSFSEFIFDATDEYMSEVYYAQHPKAQGDIHARRMLQYNAAGAAEIIRQWLLSGCPGDPVDLVEDITVNNTSDALKQALDIRADWRERAAAIGKTPGNPWV